jgi:hypothetical protein
LGVLRLIRQLVRASHALGLEVVVEGLESPGMIEAASILGADFGQGFALAHPMPPEALPDWLAGFKSVVRSTFPLSALGALAGALRWEERFVELFDEPHSRERHVKAGGSAAEYLRGVDDVSTALRTSHDAMLKAAANGPFDPDYGLRRDRFLSLLVERALSEEHRHGHQGTDIA